MSMVKEINKTIINYCHFYDYGGNWISFVTATKKFADWKIYWKICNVESIDGHYEVYIIAPKAACKEFLRDAKGSLKAKGLVSTLRCMWTLKEISSALSISEMETRAWLWSCAKHGLAQREFPCGSPERYWAF